MQFEQIQNIHSMFELSPKWAFTRVSFHQSELSPKAQFPYQIIYSTSLGMQNYFRLHQFSFSSDRPFFVYFSLRVHAQILPDSSLIHVRRDNRSITHAAAAKLAACRHRAVQLSATSTSSGNDNSPALRNYGRNRKRIFSFFVLIFPVFRKLNESLSDFLVSSFFLL